MEGRSNLRRRRGEVNEAKRSESEPRAENGNIIANSKKLSLKPTFKNEAIEKELVKFKKEIETKFAKSAMNAAYGFPR